MHGVPLQRVSLRSALLWVVCPAAVCLCALFALPLYELPRVNIEQAQRRYRQSSLMHRLKLSVSDAQLRF